jgi:hypothetical protein
MNAELEEQTIYFNIGRLRFRHNGRVNEGHRLEATHSTPQYHLPMVTPCSVTNHHCPSRFKKT